MTEKILLAERIFRAFGAEPSELVPVAMLDTDYWVYIARYQGDYGTLTNEKDLFGIVLEGMLDAEIDGEEMQIEAKEAFLVKGGTSWRPRPEGKGAVVLHFECRTKRMLAGDDAHDLDVA